MREWLIVDGYNVINNWNDFKKIRSENLEHARDLLREKIAEYVAFKGYLGLVVFDAQEVQGSSEEENYGAYRISAREFREEYKRAKKQIEEKVHASAGGLGRNELGGRLHEHVRAHFEKLRRR